MLKRKSTLVPAYTSDHAGRGPQTRPAPADTHAVTLVRRGGRDTDALEVAFRDAAYDGAELRDEATETLRDITRIMEVLTDGDV